MSTFPTCCHPIKSQMLGTSYGNDIIKAEELLNEVSTMLQPLSGDEPPYTFVPILRKLSNALDITECFLFQKRICEFYPKLRRAIKYRPNDLQDLYHVHMCCFAYQQLVYAYKKMSYAPNDNLIPTIFSAMEHINAMLDFNPNIQFLIYRKAILANQLKKDPTTLIEHMDGILERFPDYHDAHYLKCITLLQIDPEMKRYKDRINVCNLEYLKTAPVQSTHYAFMSYLQCHLRLNHDLDLKKAEEWLRKAKDAEKHWYPTTNHTIREQVIDRFTQLQAQGFNLDSDTVIPTLDEEDEDLSEEGESTDDEKIEGKDKEHQQSQKVEHSHSIWFVVALVLFCIFYETLKQRS
ncbi:hypothetical protein AKO1_002531 [Acrasis kona]|uniref:Uncharacterized protein n=1 Tax=Acrasis kona TaxID=1008807 RepID=A0AAW2ZLL3_9EUKA